MKTQRAALYLRVSTVDQHPEVQLMALKTFVKQRGWTIHKIYSDKGVSGSKERRLALDELMRDCQRRLVDVVVVWKFDRFARSVRQLVTALETFRILGIGFVSCTEAIDTSLPSGELVFQIFASIAQFERALIAERVRAGLTHARAIGKNLGRPPLRKLSSSEVKAIREERERRKTPFRELATRYGTSVWTVHGLCKR